MISPGSSRLSRLAFQTLDPDHGPAWRWELAQELAQTRSVLFRDEIAAIGDAVNFLRAMSKTTSQKERVAAKRLHPALAAAYAIYAEAGVVRDELESRILAGQPLPEIAAVTHMSTAALSAYTHYFFDLPPAGQGMDWIICKVIRIFEWKWRDPTEADTWKFLGLAGGPFVLNVIIGDFLGRAEPAIDDRHEQAERLRFLVRDRAQLLRSPIPSRVHLLETRRHAGHIIDRLPKDSRLRVQYGFLLALSRKSPVVPRVKPENALKKRVRSKKSTAVDAPGSEQPVCVKTEKYPMGVPASLTRPSRARAGGRRGDETESRKVRSPATIEDTRKVAAAGLCGGKRRPMATTDMAP